MAAPMAWLVAAVLCAAAPGAQAATPVQKALELMKKMQLTCVEDQKREAVQYSAFKQFCNDTDTAKAEAVERSTRRIEKLDGEIAKATADIEKMSARVAELEEDVDRWAKDRKAVDDIRSKEREDYTATREEYVESVAVCDRAMELLRALPSGDSHKEALVAQKAKVVSKALAGSNLTAKANVSAFDVAMAASVRQYQAAQAKERTSEQDAKALALRRAVQRKQAQSVRRALAAALDDAVRQERKAGAGGSIITQTISSRWYSQSAASPAVAAVKPTPPVPAAARTVKRPAVAALTAARATVKVKALSAESAADAELRAEVRNYQAAEANQRQKEQAEQARALAANLRKLAAASQARSDRKALAFALSEGSEDAGVDGPLVSYLPTKQLPTQPPASPVLAAHAAEPTAALTAMKTEVKAAATSHDTADSVLREDVRSYMAQQADERRRWRTVEARSIAEDLRKVDAASEARTERAALAEALSEGSEDAGVTGPLVSYLPSSQPGVRLSLLQTDEEPNPLLFKAAPDAYSYSAHSKESGGILDMVLELRTRFVEEQTDLEKEELDARHAHEQLAQRLADQAEAAESEIAFKNRRLAERKGELAEAEGEKEELEVVLADDTKYLKDLRGLCAQKAADFDARRQVRSREIDVITKAIDILTERLLPADKERQASDEALGVALIQTSRCVGPACRKEMQRRSDAAHRVAAMLAQRASALGSKVLAVAAQSARDDPFGKVKKLIRDLITRMMDEMHAMAEHNGWCQTELGTNKLTRRDKAEAADEAAAEIERLESEKARLAQDAEDLSAEVAEIEAALAKAAEQRADEKAEHEKAVAEAKEGQEAVADCLAVLRDFYEQSAQATALAQAGASQTPMEDAPSTWSAPYQGQGESKGVIGMLEVLLTDFENQQVTTEAAEMEAQSAYKRFSADTDRERAVLKTTLERKQEKAQDAESQLQSTRKSLEQTETELEAANKYYEKLKTACEAKVDFDERNARRNEEIESLTDAYKILSGEDLPSMQEMKAEQLR